MAYPYRRGPLNRGLAEGYRSGLEVKIAAELEAAGVKVQYEAVTLRYVIPERVAKYTPDWVLPNSIIVESKGRFITEDRKKHRLIKEQHPDLEIRFVFSNPNATIGKKSSTTYAMWCDKLGIQYAAKSIPTAWLKEPAKKARTAALNILINPSKETSDECPSSPLAPRRKRTSS